MLALQNEYISTQRMSAVGFSVHRDYSLIRNNENCTKHVQSTPKESREECDQNYPDRRRHQLSTGEASARATRQCQLFRESGIPKVRRMGYLCGETRLRHPSP